MLSYEMYRNELIYFIKKGLNLPSSVFLNLRSINSEPEESIDHVWQCGIRSDMMCLMYRKSSIKPPKGLFISCPFFGGGGALNRGGELI